MLVIFSISVVLGIPVLLLAMVLTSQLGGGVEFGDIRMVLLKAVPLLMIVQGLNLAGGPGPYLAIAFWWIGLMIIFSLDYWEVRMLVVVNWILNYLMYLALLAAFR